MKICIVNNLFPPYAKGGTEAVVQQTIDLLQAAGHAVVLITTEPKQRSGQPWTIEQRGRLVIYRFRPRNVYYYTEGATKPVLAKLLWHAMDVNNTADGRTLKRILQQERPDLVHSHNLKGMSYTLPSVCARLGIPYVHTLHNYQLLHPYGTFRLSDHPPLFQPRILAVAYQRWCRWQFRTVAGVISPSRLPLEMHQRVGFFRQSRTAIIPSPINLPTNVPPYSRSGPLRLAYIGALEEIKGIRSLLQAVRNLPAECYQLDIYGQGTLVDQMKKIAAAAPHIRFLGYLDDKDALGMYDGLVFPSICYETQGLAMAEALARGTPVIAANIGSVPETVTDRVNGFLYPSGSVSALTALLQHLVDHPQEIEDMRPAALTSAKRFHPDLYRTDLFRFYRQFVDFPRVGPDG